MDHLFVVCTFSREVRAYLSSYLKTNIDLKEHTLLENLNRWIEHEHKLLHLPFIFIWNTWNARNKSIFEDQEPDTWSICFSTLKLYKTCPVACSSKILRAIGMTPAIIYPTGFFDGAASQGKGGVGIILYISHSHFFQLKLGCGANTNMRVELLALWTLLKFVEAIGIRDLHIYGDSKVIISWANLVVGLLVLDL